MRLSSWLIICLLCLQLPTYSRGFGQADKKITLSGTFTLHTIFQKIEEQTGKRVYYTNAILNDEEKATIHIDKGSIDQTFAQLLKNKNLEWSIEDKYISIRKRRTDNEKFKSSIGDSTIIVTGKVMNEGGHAISGATIQVKGTQIGTTTHSDGSFTINNVSPKASLIISNIAFLTQEISIKGKSSIGIISLKEYVGVLDETQVIAYGESSRRLGTGNVNTIKAKDIEKSPVSNPLLAIAGRVPGVFIQQSTGVPGSGVKISIQGPNSMGYGNDPFYVIDGVPYTSQLLPGLTNELGESGRPGTLGSTGTGGSPLNFINPQDIESIDILKDADATSIYGSRAANGAIIITTKKGKAGKTAVRLNVQNGWGTITRKMKLLNTQQYLEMRKEAYVNDGLPVPNSSTTPATSNYDLTYWDQNRYTDWQDDLIGGTAKYTNALATISGGNDNTQFIVSTGYVSEGTVTPSSLKDQKASLHYSINNVSDNKRFKFGFSGNYILDNNKLAGVNGLSRAALTLPPNAPKLYNEDGSLNWQLLANGRNSFSNPLANLYLGYINKTNNFLTNLKIEYQLLPGLQLKSSFGYNNLTSDEIYTIPIGHLSAFTQQFSTRSAEFNAATIKSWIIEPQISYNQSIGEGKVSILLGTTIQQEDRDRQKLNASGFSSDQTLSNIKAASSVVVDPFLSNAVILSKYKYNALFTRVNYNFEDKYIANVAVRRDGSSRFGKENRFHNFASASAAWIFSSEEYIKNKVSFLSFGKLRASFGTTGNDQIGDYAYLNLYQYTRDDGVPYQGIKGLEPTLDFPNPYLQWEETKKLSGTLDLGFLKDRILINITYYKNVCSNQLLYEPLPTITGGGGVKTNLPAKVQNTGFEIGLNTSNLIGRNLNWQTNFNITIPRNKMYQYTGINTVKDEFDGKPLGVLRAYHFLGVDPSSGLYIVEDNSGKPISNPDPALDQNVFIDLNPVFYGGIQNSLTFKGFSLDILVQFTKQKGANGFFGQPIPGRSINQPTIILDRWRNAGDEVLIQKYTTTFSTLNQYSMATQSDRAYSDASYVRLKNVSISYHFPSSWLRNNFLRSAKIFMNGQNLLTVTNYVGMDPENRTFNGLPPLKMLTVGLQVGL